MSEKQGRKIEETPIAVEETEDEKDCKTRMEKLNEGIDKVLEGARDCQLQMTKLEDEVKGKEVEIGRALRQKFGTKEKLELALNDMLNFKTTKDEQQLPIASEEQSRPSSSFHVGAISEQINKIEEIRCKEKGNCFGTAQTTTEQQLEEDGLKPELKAVLKEEQVMKQTIQIHDEKVEEQLDEGSGQLEELKHPEVVVVGKQQQVMKQTIEQEMGKKKEEEESK